ncbi:hypothetical protein BP6252_02908 [Coleophoma cylindrospora]|uniref:Transcription factor domain-containing protein n=1 Tax=Coleophoma cylindrospora TaxID=1849047 RepID=A0A3D8SHS9_9HELO|nr:hypothetical protein BP6252_02908 [Coleophoma cylindrospora]
MFCHETSKVIQKNRILSGRTPGGLNSGVPQPVEWGDLAFYYTIKCTRSVGAGAVDPFNSWAVQLSSSEMRNLLDYGRYAEDHIEALIMSREHYQEMLNRWLSATMSDPLFFNAVMIKTLSHLIHVNGANFSSEALGYQARATRLLKDRISNPAEASSSATVFSVLLLVTGTILANDAAACQVHLHGIKHLLAHGGKSFEKSEQYQLIQQLLSWVDVCSACVFGTQRQFPSLFSGSSLPLSITLASSTQRQGLGFASLIHFDGCSSQFLDVICEIRRLTSIFELMKLRQRIPGSTPVFSQSCAMVNKILLSQALVVYPKTPNSMLDIGPRVVLQCCSLSAVLFVEVVLQEAQASSNVLYSLVVRLQESLADTDLWLLFGHRRIDILLWILFMGFVASLSVHGDEYSGDGTLSAWFLERFIQTMGFLKLRDYDGVRMILEKFLWVEDVNSRQLQKLWGTIRAARLVDYNTSNPGIIDGFIDAPLDIDYNNMDK